MFQQLLTIARNTFTESIRQPIFLVLVMLGIAGLVLNPSLAAYTIDDDNKLLIDLGLSTVFLAGLFLAAFTATGVLNSEVENRTVLTVVSKPVNRPVFVIGKYLGVAGAIAVAFYVLSLVFALTVRHGVLQTASDQMDLPVVLFGILALVAALGVAAAGNYLYRWVFSSTFVLTLAGALTLAAALLTVIGQHWGFQPPWADLAARDGELGQVLMGLVLVFQAVLILTAVAIAASTRLGQVMTLVVCVGVFLLGLVSNSLSQWTQHRLSIPTGLGLSQRFEAIFATDQTLAMKMLYAVAEVIYLVVPNLQFLWPADAITQGHAITGGHVALLLGYVLLYVVVVLALAVALFQTREVG